MCVVYRHRSNKDFSIFYVGIGKDVKRAYRKSQRSNYWERVAKKYGYTVEILREDISQEDACELEILLIEEYGRRDLGTGILVNMTDGGELNLGKTVSLETREKISKANKGKTRSKELREKMSRDYMGRVHSKETREKISKAQIGKVISKEIREKTSITVLQFSLDGKFIKEWVSGREAQRELKIFDIHRVCNGYRKTAGGFIWKYKDKNRR